MASPDEEQLTQLLSKLIRENKIIQDAIRDVEDPFLMPITNESESDGSHERFPIPPRNGRRESEPNSNEVTNLHDVLSANFPNDRVFWDLHHYFILNNTELNRRFDISWFQNMELPAQQSSYKAWEHENRVPDVVINVLSVSTWRDDFSDIVEFCRALKIPYYIVFAPYHVASLMYLPPFLRVYRLVENQYEQEERHDCVMHEGQMDWNENELITLGTEIPFRIGLERLIVVQGKGNPRY